MFSWIIPNLFLLLLIYLVMQIAAVVSARGVWRILAALPLLAMLGIFVIAIAGNGQPGNLWPIGLMYVALTAFLYLFVFFIVWGGWLLYCRRRSKGKDSIE